MVRASQPCCARMCGRRFLVSLARERSTMAHFMKVKVEGVEGSFAKDFPFLLRFFMLEQIRTSIFYNSKATFTLNCLSL